MAIASKSANIAAAAILAKTLRDGLLEEMDATFPGYGLAQHKGYPTAEHVEQIRKHGATPHHRRSFQPVREALGLAPRQQNIFSIQRAAKTRTSLRPRSGRRDAL